MCVSVRECILSVCMSHPKERCLYLSPSVKRDLI